MATTVTETFILEQDESKTTYPAAARERLQAAIDSGAIVSNTLTPIVDGPNLVAGKTRAHVVRVFRSAEDRTTFTNASNADTVLQAYIINSNTRRINLTIS
jgi:hypothetical protein